MNIIISYEIYTDTDTDQEVLTLLINLNYINSHNSGMVSA